MKKLLYVPILHMEADLGSLAVSLGNISRTTLGPERWERHREAVSKFWDRIAEYFSQMNVSNLKIYQDGLAADGELGHRIIEEGAKAGSKNHQIILHLIERGAELRKTESPELLIEEYQSLVDILNAGGSSHAKPDLHAYALKKTELLAARDRFMARTINETLLDGETAVVFIGAYHNFRSLLAGDIKVEEVKTPSKIKAYFKELTQGNDKRKLQALARYLSYPVNKMQSHP